MERWAANTLRTLGIILTAGFVLVVGLFLALLSLCAAQGGFAGGRHPDQAAGYASGAVLVLIVGIGWSAVGVVGEAGEETANASDSDAESEWDGVEISGGLVKSDIAFDEFDGEEAEGQSSDDGFTSDEESGVVQVLPSELRIFEPEEDLRAESGSGDGGGDHGPAQWGDEGISKAAAKSEINSEGDDVGEAFKEEVRVDDVAPEMDVDRERDREMGRKDDGEL